MKVSYFPGCTLRTKAKELDVQARACAEKLGVEPVFTVINWDNKVFELNGKGIDVVWNGMTITTAAQESMECTNAYCNNAQVIVTK